MCFVGCVVCLVDLWCGALRVGAVVLVVVGCECLAWLCGLCCLSVVEWCCSLLIVVVC